MGRKITVIGTKLAREGLRFIPLGPVEECEGCPLRGICHGLDRGRTYVITNVREKEHPCKVHEEGKVLVVEVEEVPVELAIPSRKAMEGAVISLDEEECPLVWCPNHRYCARDLFPKGEKVTIISVGKEMDCPRKLSLKRSVVKFIDEE